MFRLGRLAYLLPYFIPQALFHTLGPISYLLPLDPSMMYIQIYILVVLIIIVAKQPSMTDNKWQPFMMTFFKHASRKLAILIKMTLPLV